MAGPEDEDAFAATVAPTPSVAKVVPAPARTPPRTQDDVTTPSFKKVVLGTEDRKPPPVVVNQLSNEATVAAPITGSLPPLPKVDRALYDGDDEIARGGMGRIVAAEDRRLGRAVALKELIDPNEEAITRFQREALITARLQHPGIVPVYEAGCWPSGEPFFAMKLVHGEPLDRVIANTETLSERLELLPRLAAAADAIAYAHSQRVIHRDLKPGNVLLGAFGETVVIDWGLAKDLDANDGIDSNAPRAPRRKKKPSIAADSQATLTVVGSVMGTPAYMAPEQARGEVVDERADVFALGAMLYHVLAGQPPYNAKTATDVIAAAALGKIIPLRDRVKNAPRDLVAIMDRAMAASMDKRYPNAGELAEDLRRFLTGSLVEAHRYTPLQRVGRFVKKHRAAVAIGTVAVIGFAVGGTFAVNRIREQRDRAEYENQIATARQVAAERLIDYTMSHVQTQLNAIGRLDLMAGLGAEVKHYYDRLSKIPGGMPPGDERRMAEAIELIGRAEHVSGKPDQALETWSQAREKLLSLIQGEKGGTLRLRTMIAKLDFESAQIWNERGIGDKAHKAFELARDEYDALLKEEPKSREILLAAAANRDELGDLYRHEGKIDQAFDEFTEGKQLRDRATSSGNTASMTDEQMALAQSHMKIASIYQVRGDSQLALDELKLAKKLLESVLAGAPDNVEIQKRVIDAVEQTAQLSSSVGDDKSAIEAYRSALPVMQQLQRRDPSNTDWQYQRGNLLADLGFTLIDNGEFKEGSQQIESAIEIQKALVAKDPMSTRYKIALSRSYTRDGDGHFAVGQVEEAMTQYKTALDLRKELVAQDAASVAFRRSMAFAYAKLGMTYTARGDAAKALDSHARALDLRKQLVIDAPANGSLKNELASTEIALASVTVDPKKKSDLIEAGIARSRALVQADPINLEPKETLVQGLLVSSRSGDPAARKTLLGEAIQIADDARAKAPQNVQWPGYAAEAHAGLAELGDPNEWKAVTALLDPLAKAGRLPAPRVALLATARSH